MSRAGQRVLRWFGHVERMDEYRTARRVLMAEVNGGRVRGRLRLGWMDGVKVVSGNEMTVEAERQCAWPCVLSDCPTMIWWLSPAEGWDAVT